MGRSSFNFCSGGKYRKVVLEDLLKTWDFRYSFEGHSRDLASLPVPDPPLTDASVSKTKCPLCRGKRKNETLVPTSGYVFCYTCIVKFIRFRGICPVTKYPVKEEELVRVFDSQEGN